MAKKQNKIRKHNLQAEDGCYEKARKRGQMTFTVVEQDRTAVRTIGFWIMENLEHAPAAKLRLALEEAIEMREHPGRKWAD